MDVCFVLGGGFDLQVVGLGFLVVIDRRFGLSKCAEVC